MCFLVGQLNAEWVELAKQFPLLAVALIVALYAFKHISKQQKEHLEDIRRNSEQSLKMLNDAHVRTEGSKDSQIKAMENQIKGLLTALQSERSEKDRLFTIIENKGVTP